MPADDSPVIEITLRVRGAGADDYGIARVGFPVSAIDWSLADAPREHFTIGDIYQLDLAVGRPGEKPETDTWDRD